MKNQSCICNNFFDHFINGFNALMANILIPELKNMLLTVLEDDTVSAFAKANSISNFPFLNLDKCFTIGFDNKKNGETTQDSSNKKSD